MTPDFDRIADQINAVWATYALPLLILATIIAIVGAVLATRAVLRRGAKRVIGFGVVQAGVTVAIVTGVYDFFRLRLDMPTPEAIVLAIFIEASVWGAVGFIVAHARAGGIGFGDAGPFFAFAQAGGGILAVLGSSTTSAAIGRIVIVGFGAYMWYLQLLQVITRAGKRSSWRWTPRRLLLAVGALAPEDTDVVDEAREWQVRRLARSIRWTNSAWPWRVLGEWTLTRRAEITTEDVLAEARRRFAAAHVLRSQSRADAPTMAAVIKAVTEAATPPPGERTPADGGADTEAANQADAWRSDAGQTTGHGGGHGDRSRRAATAGHVQTAKNVQRAAVLLRRDPDLSGSGLAKQLKLSPRSGRRLKADAERYLAAVTAATAGASVNGHAVIDPATAADMARPRKNDDKEGSA